MRFFKLDWSLSNVSFSILRKIVLGFLFEEHLFYLFSLATFLVGVHAHFLTNNLNGPPNKMLGLN